MIHVVCPNPALDRTIYVNKFIQNGVCRAQSSKDLLGGKGFNVILSYLTEKERLDFRIHTFIGGYTGTYLAQLIQQENIPCSVTKINGTTRICSIIVDEAQQHAHLINENGPFIEEDEKSQFIHQLINAVGSGDIVIFSGSLPQGIDEDFYYQLTHTLQEKGAKCILDTSGFSLKEGVKAKPWLVKVNESEFFDLIEKQEHKAEKQDVIESLRNLDLEWNFIVTLGGKGSIAKFDQEIYEVTLPRITAKNATASGDIFLGALSKGLANNLTIEEALIQASTYSLSNCMYWHPHIDLSDVEIYKSQIQITKIGG
ncbi:1-phosphofructokinase family hexose kinase [Neobacillus niacini]|uniref:1-phosphofructokinase family hexose kinase n=1 Tax=Neobacillus niacini TaxID=86668 RepID=UPI002FFDB52C